MKITLTWFVILFITSNIFSQKETFEYKLNLDTCPRYGTTDINKITRGEFKVELESSLNDNLCRQILPKSTIYNNKIIINRNELEYFINADSITIRIKNIPTSIPAHWADRFGKQIQTIEFNKPLNILAIKNNKLVKFALDSIIGLRYHTFYPHGECKIFDMKIVPVVYSIENTFDIGSPILLVTTNFIENLNFEKVKINKDTIHFGSKGCPGSIYKTGIDFNDDGQNEILMYNEQVIDNITPEGDQGDSYNYSIISMYFNNRWYRTSVWSDGQDGVEGF